jgi:hypothetical protein
MLSLRRDSPRLLQRPPYLPLAAPLSATSSPVRSCSDFQLALRLRLGLPPTNSLPDTCPLCHKDMRDNRWHALGCQSLKRRSITIRHDRAMQLLVNFARSAGVLASLSPKDLSSLVPDGEFFFARETVLVDFSGTPTHADTPLLPERPVRHREEAGLQDDKVLRQLSSTQFPLCSFCHGLFWNAWLRFSRLPRRYRARSIHI